MSTKSWDSAAARVAAKVARGWGKITGASSNASKSPPPPRPPKTREDADSMQEVSSTSGSTSSPTETEESDGVGHGPPPPSVMRKKRKPTYYVRKDEMTRLKEEIEALQERLRAEENKRQQADEAINKKLVANASLASDVKQNEMVVTGMRAMICARNAQRDRNPLETYIRLTANEDERRQTLLALKEQKLFEGKEFIDEYCKRIVNPTRGMQDCQTYDTQKGDYVLDQFDLTPFVNATSAKQVYDALLGFFSAQEVSITVMMGVLSVRETDDCGESASTQCRLLTTFKSGVQVETNAVMYLRYCDRDDDGIELEEPYGIVTMDYVNQDDLYPYQSTQRVREDITLVGLIRAFANPDYENAAPHERNGIPEKVVGMARWGFTRLHRPECQVPYSAVQELRDAIRSFSDVMPNVMADIVNTRQVNKFYYQD